LAPPSDPDGFADAEDLSARVSSSCVGWWLLVAPSMGLPHRQAAGSPVCSLKSRELIECGVRQGSRSSESAELSQEGRRSTSSRMRVEISRKAAVESVVPPKADSRPSASWSTTRCRP